MTNTTAPTNEKLIQQANTLLTNNLATIYAKGLPLENAVRILAQNRMLTNQDLRNAEIANDRNAHRVFNHVPTAQFKAEQKRANNYIQALERATTALLAQIDAMSQLAAVRKTVKGQQATEQAARAKAFIEQAEARHRDSRTHSSDSQ